MTGALAPVQPRDCNGTGIGGMPRPLRAIVFDFDGVIVESADIKTTAFRMLFRPYGDAVVSAAVAHHQANGGISRRKKIRHCHRTLLGRTLDEHELDALCAQFSDMVEDAVVEAPAVPGALDVLTRLRPQLPMFIVSGTPQDELTRIVARRGLSKAFVEVHGSPPEKPPIIRTLLDRNHLAADGVLFVGDAMTDYRAARETGLAFIGRVAPHHANPFPADVRVIQDLRQLSL